MKVRGDIEAFVRKHTAHFDESHNITHALKVYENALLIDKLDCQGHYDDEILQFSCLLHDVCDRKYEHSISKEQLFDWTCDQIGRDKAEVVRHIIDNMSYTVQNKGLSVRLDPPFDVYQDIVSDADKLEALGQIGLDRCIEFTKQRGGKIPEDVVEHAKEKLLRLRDEFIRTRAGKRLALPLHQVIQDYVDVHR